MRSRGCGLRLTERFESEGETGLNGEEKQMRGSRGR